MREAMLNARFITSTGIFAVTMLVGMTALEWLRHLLLPALTGWKSQAVDTFLGAMLATVAFCVLLRKSLDKQNEVRKWVGSRVPSSRVMSGEETQYQAIVETLDELVVRFRPDTTLTFLNPAYCRFFGGTPSELIGRPFWHRLLEDDRERLRNHLAGFGAAKPAGSIEYRVFDANGEPRWQHWSHRALFDDQRGAIEFQAVGRDITEQKENEEALRRSENRYKETADLLPQPVFEMDFDGNVYFANRSALELFSVTELDLHRGLNAFRMLVPEERKTALENLGRKLAGESFGWTEYTALTSTGSTFPAMMRSALIYENGHPVGLRGIIIDITGRKRIEEALTQSNEYLENILENSPDAIAIVDRHGRFTKVNRMASELFDYPFEALKSEGKTAFEFYAHENELDSMLAILRRDGFVKKHAMNMKRRDGTIFPCEISIGLLRDRNGKNLGSVSVVRDVSEVKRTLSALKASNERLRREIAERRRIEKALRKSEDTYRTIFEHTGTAMVIIEEDSTVSLANSECQDLTGYSKEEIEGKKKWTEFIIPEDVGKMLDIHRMRLLDPHSAPVKYEFRMKDRTGDIKHILATVGMISRTKRGVASLIDLTEQKKFEADFFRTQKMESLGVLAGGIAHDFNNILAAIIGYTELAMHLASDDGRLRNYLNQIHDASLRVKDLVKQILDFSRQSGSERVPVQMSHVVKEALKLLRATIPSTIEIRQDIQSRDGIVFADPTQIHQVLMNLGTNAAHAMQKHGGILEVVLSGAYLDPATARRFADLSPGNYLRLSVRDTGTGMSPEILGRIFEPYFTTKEKGVGTGLGLAVVHGIIKSHGGAISVRSQEGSGSTFQVFLPATMNKAIQHSKQLTSLPSGNETILFVDDEKMLVETGKEALQHLGYHVVGRTSSIEALEAFRARPDAFDLVITDMTMPNLTGRGLAKELIKLRPKLPIILCTGFSEMINEEEAKELGIKHFVYKPIVIEDLARMVRDVLDGATDAAPDTMPGKREKP